MDGRIDFRYDQMNDTVFVTPHWNLESLADITKWYAQYETYFTSNFPDRKVDLVLVLGDFHVAPSIASRWGEYRVKIHSLYTRFSCRLKMDSRVRLHVLTSGAIHGASKQAQEAGSIAEAVQMIGTARQLDAAQQAAQSKPAHEGLNRPGISGNSVT